MVPSPECHLNNAPPYVLVSVSKSHPMSASRISGWHLFARERLERVRCCFAQVPRYRRRQPGGGVGGGSRYSTGELPRAINLLLFQFAIHSGEFGEPHLHTHRAVESTSDINRASAPGVQLQRCVFVPNRLPFRECSFLFVFLFVFILEIP